MMGPLGHWGWLGLGLLLIAAELLAPGAFLLWIGIAALLVGLTELFFVPGWAGELLLFAGYSVVAVLAGLRVYQARPRDNGGLVLNERLAELRGRVFHLDAAIVEGYGRIRLGDSVWRVKGPDLPAGARVEVTGLEGATLVVVPAADRAGS